MLIIDILNDAKQYSDRYDTMDSIKISIHKNLKKLVIDSDIIKNIPEKEDLDTLIQLYKNSTKHYEN